jgi:tetratricopeptide (TPR) repeat protein
VTLIIQRWFRILVLPCALAALVFGQDEEALKQAIRSRAGSVAELVASGAAKEGSAGLLQPAGTIDATQSQILTDENRDRLAVFKIIGKKSGLTPEEVAALFLPRRARSLTASTGAGVGPCKLIPAKTPDALRLVQYLKQGMVFALNKKYDMALAEFKPALAIDTNFLTLHLNLGAAQLALRKYDEASASAKEELKLIGCLEPLTDPQLAAFSYFMEVLEKDASKRGKAQAQAVREQLPKVKAAAYYNLACIYSRQQKANDALESLKAAVAAGFDDKKSLMADPDLAAVRQSPEFKIIAASIGKAKSSL